MPEPDADRRPADRGLSPAWILRIREIFKESAKQRAHAERQRNAARSMREEADDMRTRSTRDWPRPP